MFAAGPNVVPAAAADEAPTDGPKAALELPALHESQYTHIRVIVKWLITGFFSRSPSVEGPGSFCYHEGAFVGG